MQSSSAPKLLLLHHKAPVLLGGGVGQAIPYSINFSTQPNGSLPSPWVAGATWAIATGVAVCTPATYSAELLTDPGLEANYTDGKCDSLTRSGSPTLAQSADAHGGAKAQEITPTAYQDRIFWQITPTANQWYLMSSWAKRTSGTNGGLGAFFSDTGGGSWAEYVPTVTAGSYTQVFYSRMVKGNFRIGANQNSSPASFDTMVFDDGSVKQLTFSELAALISSTSANAAVKANLSYANSMNVGVIARANATSNPTDFLIAILAKTSSSTNSAYLLKCVNGVYTYLTGANVVYSAGRLLEIRCNGTSIELWYNNAQIGTTQTVNEPTINNNRNHGMFSTSGGNSLNSFFLAAP